MKPLCPNESLDCIFLEIKYDIYIPARRWFLIFSQKLKLQVKFKFLTATSMKIVDLWNVVASRSLLILTDISEEFRGITEAVQSFETSVSISKLRDTRSHKTAIVWLQVSEN